MLMHGQARAAADISRRSSRVVRITVEHRADLRGRAGLPYSSYHELRIDRGLPPCDLGKKPDVQRAALAPISILALGAELTE